MTHPHTPPPADASSAPAKPCLVYLTAGAGGMLCGSCLHDNTLARALTRRGIDTRLVPTYTPIRTDEQNVSVDRVFFGGLNVYLQQKIPLFRHLPAFLDRFLDQPWLIRRVASLASQTDPRFLGELTVSMLRGEQGRQRKEVRRLVAYLQGGRASRGSAPGDRKPDVIVLSNLLIGGCVPAIQRALGVPVIVTLQGDDIFLRELPEPYQTQALAELRQLARQVDGFLTHSRFYAEFMGDLLRIPADKIHVVPLGIDTADFETSAGKAPDAPNAANLAIAPTAGDAPTGGDAPPSGDKASAGGQRVVGYLARLAPEKGLHALVDAFILLRREHHVDNARLRVAGWLGAHRRAYAEEQWQKLRAAGLADAFEYAGELDRAGKVAFLRSLDVFSAPGDYADPKGLFVLEALAAGAAVAQPDHGAFPELARATGGVTLTRVGDVEHLAETLAELLRDDARRTTLARQGQAAVLARHNADAMAENTWRVLEKFIAPQGGPSRHGAR